MNTALKSKVATQILNERLIALYKDDTEKPAFAPFETLGKEMVDRLPRIEGDVLVLSDAGLLIAVLRRLKADGSKANVRFIAHTEAVRDFVLKLGVEVDLVCYNELQSWFKKDIGMKFDVVVMNPPYGNLHLPILKKAVEHLTDEGVCVSIQPVRWLQDPLWQAKKNSDARKMQPVLDGKIESVDVISAKDATEIFNAAFPMDLAVFIIKSNNGSFDYSALASERYGANLRPFRHLLEDKVGFKTELYNPAMKNFVPLVRIGASASKRTIDTTTIHRPYGFVTNGLTNSCKYGNGITLEEARKRNTRVTVGGDLSNLPVKSFNTAEEAKNFFEYIKLEAFRFFVYVTTLDVNIQCEYLPVPVEPDAFTTPWNDKRFLEYFKISAAGADVIKHTMVGKTNDPYLKTK